MNLAHIIDEHAPDHVAIISRGVETTFQRSHLRSLRNEDSSLMPEDLQVGLKPQDLADLLRFIETLEK